MTFEDVGGKTRLTMRMVFPHQQLRWHHFTIEKYGADKGQQEHLDRLGEYTASLDEHRENSLKMTLPSDREVKLSGVVDTPRQLVLTRTFNAPRRLVFEAWTDPRQLARWWGPKGFTNPVCEADAHPGGAIRIHMTAPDGTIYPMTGVFLEVSPPDRLVFTVLAFEDAQGNARLENHNTVTFTEHDGKTTLTLHVVVVKASPEVARPSSKEWSRGGPKPLDRLEALFV